MNSKLIVSRLLFLALGVSLFVGSVSFAQTAKRPASASRESVLEPIAPLINENTVLVLRVNLDAVDYDRFGETLKTLFNQAILLAGYSQESVEACNVEFAKTIEALKGDAKENVEDFEKNYGFKTAFLVVQTTKGEGSCLVVPAKDMSKEQVDKVVEVLESGGVVKAALYKKSFILASPKPLKELGAFYKNFKPASNKALETFFDANSDKLLTFYTSRFKIRPLFTPSKEDFELKRQEALKATKEQEQQGRGRVKTPNRTQERAWGQNQGDTTARTSSAARESVAGSNKPNVKSDAKIYDPFADAPQCVRSLIEVFDSSFVGAQGYVDVAGLDFNLTLRFNTAVNSGKFVDRLDDLIDEFTPMFFNGLERSLNAEEFERNASLVGLQERVSKVSTNFIERYRLAPLWRQMITGDLKRSLPKSYDTNVVFGGSAVESLKRVGSNTVFVAAFFGTLAAFDRQEAWNEAEEEEKFNPSIDATTTFDANAVLGGSSVDAINQAVPNMGIGVNLFGSLGALNRMKPQNEVDDDFEFNPFDDESETSDVQETTQEPEKSESSATPKAESNASSK